MKIPAKWQEVLNKVQEVFPGAIIAGGALRDLDHGHPAKDVDIFIPIDRIEFNDAEEINEYYEPIVLKMFPYATLKTASVYASQSNMMRTIDAIYNVTDDEGMTYELIFVVSDKTVEGILNQFDISLCQIGYDGGLIYRMPAYDESKDTLMIKVMNVNRADRQEKRIKRILTKYPQYRSEPCPIPQLLPF